MILSPHDAPWGLMVSLVPKSVVDLFHRVSLAGSVDIPLPPAEQTALKARLQAAGIAAAGIDFSVIGQTAYELFLPTYEEYAQYLSAGDMPGAQVSIAQMYRQYLAGNFAGDLAKVNQDVWKAVQRGRGDGSDARDRDFTLWYATPTVCDILIVNGLNEPLTVADPDIEHGFPIFFPQVTTPIDHGDPVVATSNVIAGRTAMPDGTNRFGLGVFRFQKGLGALHGTEGAMQLTTSDPAAPKPIGIAWGLDYYNKPSAAVTADLSQYNSLQAFYSATTSASKSISGETKFGVSVTCFIDYASRNSPGKADGHRVVTVAILPKDGVKASDSAPPAPVADPLKAIMKNVAAALPAPPAPPFLGPMNPPGPGNPNKLPPNVVPFVNNDDN